MWFIWIIIGIVSTTIIIINLWEKFQTNPTITGLDTDFHNWEVEFPAVTICQQTPTTEEKIKGYIWEHFKRNDTTSNDTDFFYKLTQLSINTWTDFTENYSMEDIVDKEIDFKELIINITNQCEDIFSVCHWKSTAYNCCDIFHPVFTENGFCYAFNSKHYDRNTISSEQSKFVKRYIQETDLKWSITLQVNSKASFFAVYILNTNELTSVDTKPQHIWDFSIDTILFSVKQTYTTEDTSQLNLKQRRCAFQNDMKIKIDDTYSYSACTTECRMKNAIKYCSCVPFFYPIETTIYRHCKIHEMKCISKYLDKIILVEKCNCHLGCLHTAYEIEKLNLLLSNKDNLPVSLEIKFVSWPMVRYKREVLFGWVDLLVSFGGIAGLFLGFSLLSAVEIVYYFIVRIFCMTTKKGTKSKNVRMIRVQQKYKGFDIPVPVLQQQRLSHVNLSREKY